MIQDEMDEFGCDDLTASLYLNNLLTCPILPCPDVEGQRVTPV